MNTIVHFITLEISLRLCMDDVKLSRDKGSEIKVVRIEQSIAYLKALGPLINNLKSDFKNIEY